MEDSQRSLVVRIREFLAVRRRLALAGCVVAGAFLLSLLVSNPTRSPLHQSSNFSVPDHGSPDSEILGPGGVRPEESERKSLVPQSSPYLAATVDMAGAAHEPRIYYSAELSLVTKEFARSRSSLEDILERHHGYTSRLRMVGQPSGSILNTTLRVPSSEYRPTLVELKTVGLVEHEEEAADEVTQQHSELEARLVNAQNEEQRILQLLQNRKDKTTDPSSLERQVALLRGEIARMQSERYSSDSRATLANISLSLREERTPPAETIGAKFRAAAVEGLSDAFESVSALLLFLAGRGPLLALWAALVYFPLRFLWRRRTQWAFSQAEPSKNS